MMSPDSHDRIVLRLVSLSDALSYLSGQEECSGTGLAPMLRILADDVGDCAEALDPGCRDDVETE